MTRPVIRLRIAQASPNLDLLAGRAPGAQAPSNRGLIANRRCLDQRWATIAGRPLPSEAAPSGNDQFVRQCPFEGISASSNRRAPGPCADREAHEYFRGWRDRRDGRASVQSAKNCLHQRKGHPRTRRGSSRPIIPPLFQHEPHVRAPNA